MPVHSQGCDQKSFTVKTRISEEDAITLIKMTCDRFDFVSGKAFFKAF
jgi:hypothetical protein